MSYDYNIRWGYNESDESFPRETWYMRVRERAMERAKLYSGIHPGEFSVFPELPGGKYLFFIQKCGRTAFPGCIAVFKDGEKIF